MFQTTPNMGKGETNLVALLNEHLEGEEPDQCLEWPGGTANGYPKMNYRNFKWIQVRRLVYGWVKGLAGPWTGGYLTTTCGNPNCINPRHVLEK